MKQVLHRLLETAKEGDTPSRIMDGCVVTMIVLNVVMVSLETIPNLIQSFMLPYLAFKFFSVIFFCLEYTLRVWSCVCDPKYSAPIRGRIRYMTTPVAIIDFLALIPFITLLVVPYEVSMQDIFILSSLRIMRLVQLVRLVRYSTSLHTLGRVLMAKTDELLMSLFVVLLLLTVASSGVYFLEHDSQPDSFSSIPASAWWAVSTLTTVGYGDMTPITVGGRLLGGVIAILGVGMFALPAGILASGFAEELQRNQAKQKGLKRYTYCPHCREQLVASLAPTTNAQVRSGIGLIPSMESPIVRDPDPDQE